MEKFDMYKYNFYTLLPIDIGSSKEKIDVVYERYKRLNTNDTVASKQILDILQKHYTLLEQIGLEEYNKRVTKQKDNKIDFEKWLDDPENQKHSYAPATARAMNYEKEFMQRESNKLEFDENKLSNVNKGKINKIGNKFVVVVVTAAIAIAGAVGVAVWNANKDFEPIYSDDSTSISQDVEPETYTFKYIVQSGDTYVSILQKFGLYTPESNYYNHTIYKGDELQFTVSDKELAEEWQRIYDIQTTKPIMVEWDEYTIMSGDTPMDIADKFEVPVEYIIRFNKSDYFCAIPDAHTCYAGYTIKIPTKILTGEDAYNYNQAKIAENSSMKAVG